MEPLTVIAAALGVLAFAAALAALVLGYRLAIAYAALIDTLIETDRIERTHDI